MVLLIQQNTASLVLYEGILAIDIRNNCARFSQVNLVRTLLIAVCRSKLGYNFSNRGRNFVLYECNSEAGSLANHLNGSSTGFLLA